MSNDQRKSLARRRAAAGIAAQQGAERQPTVADYLPGDDATEADWLTYLIARRELPPASFQPDEETLAPYQASGLPPAAARIVAWRIEVMSTEPQVARAYHKRRT